MADLEFFLDPICPWAWITSRWVVEVQQQRHYEVEWRFISLQFINEDRTSEWYTPKYRAGHAAGTNALRVADAVRLADGNAAVGRLYTAMGTAIHVDRRRDELVDTPADFLAEMLGVAGADPGLAKHFDDTTHDAYLRDDTELAFSRTGPDVGTPILTFRPGAPDEGSFFGPVISKAPRGDDAVRLWDAVEQLATTSYMAELKRSTRGKPDFA